MGNGTESTYAYNHLAMISSTPYIDEKPFTAENPTTTTTKRATWHNILPLHGGFFFFYSYLCNNGVSEVRHRTGNQQDAFS